MDWQKNLYRSYLKGYTGTIVMAPARAVGYFRGEAPQIHIQALKNALDAIRREGDDAVVGPLAETVRIERGFHERDDALYAKALGIYHRGANQEPATFANFVKALKVAGIEDDGWREA